MGIMRLRKGDDFVARATFTSDGVAYSMSGWTIEASLQFANCPAADMTVSGLEANVFQLSLNEQETANLEVGDHELQIRSTSPGGVSTSTTPATVRVRE